MKKYPSQPNLSELDSNKLEEFYKKFGLIICLYQGIEQSVIMQVLLAKCKENIDPKFSQLSKKLESMSLGTLLRDYKNFISQGLYEDLVKLKNNRNYFAHRYYHDNIFKIMTNTDEVLIELDSEIEKLEKFNYLLDLERKQNMKNTIGEEKIKALVEELFD